MLLIVDGESYQLGESDMQRPLTINCSDTNAAEWNRPNSIESRLRAHNAMLARHAALRAACDLAPRRAGILASVARWLNEEVR